MQLFYGIAIEDNIITLSEQESSHCARVLRMKANDTIDVTDGNGNLYKGIVKIIHEKKTTVEIIETKQTVPLSYQLHLYVAITKQADRIEWMIEKCVEIGLTSFTPIITHRTERKNIRTDRLALIALSAMKQSLKGWLPKINIPQKFENVIKNLTTGTKLIAHCANNENKVALTDIKMGSSTHIFIGPEGDFTKEEVALALTNGFSAITMGESRLRTETAGLMACSFMYWNNKNKF